MVEASGMGGMRKVAVIGAGTMGPGIALTFAAHGHEVTLCDNREEALSRAKRLFFSALDTLIRAGALPAEAAAAAPAHLRLTTSLAEAGGDAGLVVEAVYESIEVKRAVLAELDAVCPPRAVFASNTSYLDVFACTPRPERTVIAHWFAPPHILPLVEVVRGPRTAEGVVEEVAAVLKGVGKTPVVLRRYLPGFAVNRLQRAIGREVLYLLQNGYISAGDLDLAVKASIAPRMMLLGVVQRYDFAGLDLTAGNLANEAYEEAPVDRAPEVLLRLVREGNFGVKSGKGFCDYVDHEVEDVLRARDEGLLAIMESARPFLAPQMPLVGSAQPLGPDAAGQ